MSEIDWDKEKITSKEWLQVNVKKESIFHIIQYLGLQKLNVIELDILRLTKRKVYGLICVSDDDIKLEEEKPYIIDDDSHLFGPSQVSTQILKDSSQKKLIFPQNIVNADVTINLLNFALLASTSSFGERCGPTLKKYFNDAQVDKSISQGNDLLSRVFPLAFVHNYTAKKYPGENFRKTCTYFAYYHSTATNNADDDRILKIDPRGDLIEFSLSDSGLLHFCTSMYDRGVTNIYAIVEDNSQEDVQKLSEERAAMLEESGETDWLDNSTYLDKSLSSRLNAFEDSEKPGNHLTTLAELTVLMENVIDSSDYDLIIEDENGQQDTSLLNTTRHSEEDEEKFKDFRERIKRVSMAKSEFKKLWFEGMENYELYADPEFDAFHESYRLILRQDDEELMKEVNDLLASQNKLPDSQPRSSEERHSEKNKENVASNSGKVIRAQAQQIEDETRRSRKRRAASSTSKSPIRTESESKAIGNRRKKV